ncbi:unnamed protein product [Hymenolepis diminuta]|uniref:Integrase catalytic domain-containing protein n=1 Tax=Hymenolepis diminuta TaxID=6216 RepID=A0A0R3SBR8_HYMDI|nr:unnamed protein product [Hymenolepis diminuta]
MFLTHLLLPFLLILLNVLLNHRLYLSPKLPSATPVQAPNDGMKLHHHTISPLSLPCPSYSPSRNPGRVITRRGYTFSSSGSHVLSQTKAPWTRIDLLLTTPIRAIHYLILVDPYSMWPEFIPIKSAKTGTVIGSLRRIFANHGEPKFIESRNVTHFSTIPSDHLCRGPNTLRLISMV